MVAFDNKTQSRQVERLDIMNVQEQEERNGHRKPVLVNVSHHDRLYLLPTILWFYLTPRVPIQRT